MLPQGSRAPWRSLLLKAQPTPALAAHGAMHPPQHPNTWDGRCLLTPPYPHQLQTHGSVSPGVEAVVGGNGFQSPPHARLRGRPGLNTWLQLHVVLQESSSSQECEPSAWLLLPLCSIRCSVPQEERCFPGSVKAGTTDAGNWSA